MPAPAKNTLQDAIEHQQLSASSLLKLSGSPVLGAQTRHPEGKRKLYF